MQSTPSGRFVLITPDKEDKIRQKMEDSLYRCWRRCNPLSPRMDLSFHIYSEEIYRSQVGNLEILTPVWRGKTFTDAVIMRELLRWSIYPKDHHRAMSDVLSVRRMLAEDFSFTPQKKKKLLDEEYDWTGFPYSLRELLLVQDILGCYLVDYHLHDKYNNLWNEIWHYLRSYGALGARKTGGRDKLSLLYLSSYPKFIPELQGLNPRLLDIEEDSRKVANILNKILQGEMNNLVGLRQLAIVFHKYFQARKKEREGKGTGADYKRPPKCPQCGNKNFEIVAYEDPETGKWVTMQELDQCPPVLRVKIRCRKCGWESIEEIEGSPIESLKPKEPDFTSKEQIENLLRQSSSASDKGSRKEGTKIAKKEHMDQEELSKIRRFLLKDIIYVKKIRKSLGEKYQISTVPWRMGDRFKDVDITSSEIKSIGIEDLRLIPGVSLQRREYDFARAPSKEMLKGSRFIIFLDVSGSMFATGAINRMASVMNSDSHKNPSHPKTKIGKALLVAEKIYHLSKQSNFEFHLTIFSDIAAKVPHKKLDIFFNSEFSPGLFSGGTVLSKALELYTYKEYRNSNVVILSDMDLSDFDKTQEKLTRIGEVTNSFKILLFKPPPRAHIPSSPEKTKRKQLSKAKRLFPDRNVKIMRMNVG